MEIIVLPYDKVVKIRYSNELELKALCDLLLSFPNVSIKTNKVNL